MFWLYSKKEGKLLLNATLLLFASFALLLGQNWQALEERDAQLTANTVGIYAGVPENEVNTLLAQLDEREKVLEIREEAILQTENTSDRKTFILMLVVGSGLLGLILLNFYLDSKRRNSLA